jgi:hypothetical protein
VEQLAVPGVASRVAESTSSHNVGEVFIFYGAKGENLGRYAILPNA